MTEAEWAGGFALMSMLDFIEPKESNRKLRLFACGCCRRIWPLLVCDESRAAVERAEEYVDGRATLQELSAAQERADQAVYQWVHRLRDTAERQRAAAAAVAGRQASYPAETSEAVADRAKQAAKWSWSAEQLVRDRRPESNDDWCQIVRCVFGNPFRPVTPDPRWRTSVVLSLAEQMYDSRDFAAMPILADALEEAGCDNTDVLNHCRSGGPHVRGCWVVDLILGKS